MRINMVMLPTDISVLKTTMEKHSGSEHNNGKGHVFVCVCVCLCVRVDTTQEAFGSAGQSNWHLINWGLRSRSLPF